MTRLRTALLLQGLLLAGGPTLAQEIVVQGQSTVAEVEGFHRVGAALGDIDGDRVDDLVLSKNGAFALRRGKPSEGERTFEDERPLGISVAPSCEHAGPPVLVDLDSDGDLDLVSLDSPWSGRERAVFFANDGAGRFEASVPLTDPTGAPLVWDGQASGIACADWDGDGQGDLLIAQGNVLWFRGAGTRFAQAPLDLGVPSQGAVVVCDQDRDGTPDLITVEDGQLRRRSRADLATAVAIGPLPEDPAQAQVSAADWDRDGRVDLLVGHTVATPPVAAARSEPSPRIESAQRVLAAIDAERARLDREVPAGLDRATMEKRAARRAELDAWAAGPRAVLEAHAAEQGGRPEPRARVQVWMRG
ncbi:MAG: FG-GAP repeat domain-containing protein [Planctomycetota bacterium]